eukprot:3982363-Amphidinium_carterae.1
MAARSLTMCCDTSFWHASAAQSGKATLDLQSIQQLNLTAIDKPFEAARHLTPVTVLSET